MDSSGAQVPPHLGSIWTAFWTLGTCRPAGFGGALPIPWTAARDYAAVHGLDLDRFWQLLQAMDSDYLKHVNQPDS